MPKKKKDGLEPNIFSPKSLRYIKENYFPKPAITALFTALVLGAMIASNAVLSEDENIPDKPQPAQQMEIFTPAPS